MCGDSRYGTFMGRPWGATSAGLGYGGLTIVRPGPRPAAVGLDMQQWLCSVADDAGCGIRKPSVSRLY